MNDYSTESASWGELLTGRNGVMSVILTGGVCLHAINTYISTTMLPSIVNDIGGKEFYAWNMTLYVLAGILTAAVTGVLLQRTGPRLAYGIGSAIFLTGSLIASVSPSMIVMLIGRTLQGAGGGMLTALCYSMIMLVFPQRLWPRAMALLSGVYGVAMLIGPAVGGIFAEMNAWRYGFAVLIPISLLYMLATSVLLPKRDEHPTSRTGLPVLQLLFLTIAVLAISIGGSVTSVMWGMTAITVSIVFMCLMVRCENTHSSRIFPRGTFRLGSPLFLTFATMSLLVLSISSEIYVPYFLQVLHGQSPLYAGYIAALMSVGWVAAEIFSARWTGSAVLRAISLGPILTVLGMVGLLFTLPHYSSSGVLVVSMIGASLVMIGMGVGIGWPHLSTFVFQFAPKGDEDLAGSALSAIQMLAIAFGSAIAGLVVNSTGFNDPEGLDGVSNSARWLFITWSFVLVWSVLTASKLKAVLLPTDGKEPV